MFKIAPHIDDAAFEPLPRFASDAEIALAEQLRHQLEERYFGASATFPTLVPQPREVH